MFGVDDVAETDAIAAAADAITSRFEPSRVPMEIPLWVPTPANRRYRNATDELDDVIGSILRRRRASGDELNGGDSSDLCSALLSAGESGTLSDDEIRDHLVTMLLAGHETTAIALTYALGLLATHPDERKRVLEEVRAVDELTPQTNLPRTDRVVRESLRLYPPTYMLFRQTTKPDTVAGYEVPAGTRVVLSQWAIHRSDRYYDDPLAFRPGRWTSEMRESPRVRVLPVRRRRAPVYWPAIRPARASARPRANPSLGSTRGDARDGTVADASVDVASREPRLGAGSAVSGRSRVGRNRTRSHRSTCVCASNPPRTSGFAICRAHGGTSYHPSSRSRSSGISAFPGASVSHSRHR